MEMRLHTWLLLFLFYACFTQGLAENKENADDLEEKGEVEPEPKTKNIEVKEQVAQKPTKEALEVKEQAQQKPHKEKLQEKVQDQEKVQVEHSEAAGQNKLQGEHTEGEGLGQNKKNVKNLKGKEPEQKKIDKTPEHKEAGQKKVDAKITEGKEEQQKAVDVKPPEEQGKQPKKVDVETPQGKDKGQKKVDGEIPKKRGKKKEKVKGKLSEKKGQEQANVGVQNAELEEQSQNKVDVKRPAEKRQTQNKVDVERPQEKGQGQKKLDVQQPEGKEQGRKKVEHKISQEKEKEQKEMAVKIPEKKEAQSKVDTKEPKLKEEAQSKVDLKIPKLKGPGQNKVNVQHPEEKGFRRPKAETAKPEGKGQGQSKVQDKTPQEKEKGKKTDAKIAEEKEKGQKQVDAKIPGEKEQGQSKVGAQRMEEKASAPPRRCLEKPKKGPCKEAKRRYYFNGSQCVEFIWGGCEKNGNNFKSKCACERKCFGRKLPCVCYQPKDVGPCRAAMTRWYYSVRSQKCKKFTWGGCKPNGNNFETKKQCKEKCGELGKPKVEAEKLEGKAPKQEKAERGTLEVQGKKLPSECYEPKKVGVCRAAIPRWYYDGRECKTFIWGGCSPNGNNFKTKQQCEERCAAPPLNCFEPLKVGPCRAAIPRFWFDGITCKEFRWGGCAPNGNNFRTKLQCEKKCKGQAPHPTCIGPKKKGPCSRTKRRWWFNGKVCREFIYGGCGSNGNNYKSKEECEKTCIAPEPNCVDPKKVGPCKGVAARFFFDGRDCRRFLWGGCFPNGNNFRTKFQCEKKCIAQKRPPVCNLPLKTGPCKAAIPRWYFNGKDCLEFLWGGCAPNGNNFRTKGICERKCLGMRKLKTGKGSVAPKKDV